MPSSNEMQILWGNVTRYFAEDPSKITIDLKKNALKAFKPMGLYFEL